jgi:uncharacterized repeat protein (TIGR04076 family)
MTLQPKAKITVIKRSLNTDIIDAYMNPEMKHHTLCTKVREGDEFLIHSEWDMPENFCPWAWADIRQDILAVVNGAQFPWIGQRGVTVSGCTDWFRPVLFKIEKL